MEILLIGGILLLLLTFQDDQAVRPSTGPEAPVPPAPPAPPVPIPLPKGKKRNLPPETLNPNIHKHGAEKRLTFHLDVGDFLKSEIWPDLVRYKLTDREYRNLYQLANLLEDARKHAGAWLRIDGGGRPPAFEQLKGSTFWWELKRRGYEPSKNSDHRDFSGADVAFLDSKQRVGPGKTAAAFSYLKLHPTVRQVIMYIHPTTGVPLFLHVAAKVPGKGKAKIKAFRRPFRKLLRRKGG